MRKLLVTGGAGFIGSNFVHHWLAKHPGDRVVVLDSLTYAGNKENLRSAQDRPEYRFVHDDINNTELVASLLDNEKLDTIVNFAAESHVDRSITSPDAFVTTNVVGAHSLLKAARKVWLMKSSAVEHRFHQVSTDEVYGSLESQDSPFQESSPYAPNSPYAATKAAADYLVRAYHRTYGLNATISNCSNNYGPFHFPEKLIPLTIINLLMGRKVSIYGDGKNVRDWLHVRDHCRALELILFKGTVGATYNIGGQSEYENIEVVKMICQILDDLFRQFPHLAKRFPRSPWAQNRPSASLIQFVDDRPGHDRRYAIDATKIVKQFAYTQTIGLKDGLRDTCIWYCDNEFWWRTNAAERSN